MSGAIRPGGKQVSAEMEVTVDESVSAKKVLYLPRRFESLHMSFAPAGRVDVSLPSDCSGTGGIVTVTGSGMLVKTGETD
jgi:hypothetical protein